MMTCMSRRNLIMHSSIGLHRQMCKRNKKERVKKATIDANTFANRLTNALFTEEELKEKVDKANSDANGLANKLTSALVARTAAREKFLIGKITACLLYTSTCQRDSLATRMPAIP